MTGRMRRLLSCCSITWAPPATRTQRKSVFNSEKSNSQNTGRRKDRRWRTIASPSITCQSRNRTQFSFPVRFPVARDLRIAGTENPPCKRDDRIHDLVFRPSFSLTMPLQIRRPDFLKHLHRLLIRSACSGPFRVATAK